MILNDTFDIFNPVIANWNIPILIIVFIDSFLLFTI